MQKTTVKLEEDVNSLLDEIKNLQLNEDSEVFDDFMNKVSEMVDTGIINRDHYHWGIEGKLRIWWRAIWDLYTKPMQEVDNDVNKVIIKKEFLKLSDQNKMVNLNYKGQSRDYIRQKGFRIKHAHENEVLANTFNCPK
jgi:hypothetical protein